MDFYTYTTTRDACSKAGLDQHPDAFYETALADALAIQSAQFFFQLNNERDWEQQKRPYYNVWPSIVPMLTRLNLDLDSGLIQLPMPALSIRLPKQQNPRSVASTKREFLAWQSTARRTDSLHRRRKIRNPPASRIRLTTT